MEKGWTRNSDRNYEHGYEDGYREALMALPKLWESATEDLKTIARAQQAIEKQKQRLNKNKNARIL